MVKYNDINNELVSRNRSSILSKFLHSVRVNKQSVSFLTDKEKTATALDSIQSNGSMLISYQRINREFNYTSSKGEYDLNQESLEKKSCFEKFQTLCTLNNIKLILVYSPNFKEHNKLFEKRIYQLSQPKTLYFIYDTLNLDYKNSSFFYDETHLKRDGANIFTNELIENLRKRGYK